MADVEVAGVGEHDDVGRHLGPGTSSRKLAQVLGADLLLALDDELHVEGQRPARAELRADGGDVGHDAGLVVGRAAAVEPAVALLGSKAGDSHFSGRPGGCTSWCP